MNIEGSTTAPTGCWAFLYLPILKNCSIQKYYVIMCDLFEVGWAYIHFSTNVRPLQGRAVEETFASLKMMNDCQSD